MPIHFLPLEISLKFFFVVGAECQAHHLICITTWATSATTPKPPPTASCPRPLREFAVQSLLCRRKKPFPTRLRKSLITFLFAELFSIFLGMLVAKCQDQVPHHLQLLQALQRRENLVQLPRGPLFRVPFQIFFLQIKIKFEIVPFFSRRHGKRLKPLFGLQCFILLVPLIDLDAVLCCANKSVRPCILNPLEIRQTPLFPNHRLNFIYTERETFMLR